MIVLYLCRGKGKGHTVSYDWQKEYNTHSWPRPLYPPGMSSGIHLKEGGWASRPVGLDMMNLFPPTGIRKPDRPARSQSLHRIIYPGL